MVHSQSRSGGRLYRGAVRVVHFSPAPLYRDGDTVGVAARTVAGLIEMANHWDGDVVVVGPTKPWSSAAVPRVVPIAPGSMPFSVVASVNPFDALRELAPDAVTGLHGPEAGPLLDCGIPAVLTSEVNASVRLGQLRASVALGPSWVRILAGQARVEARMRASAGRAVGLQCNGPAAMESYGPHNRSSMMFHDHRIRTADLAAATSRDLWDGSRPLRLAFSGRLTAIKGIGDVLEFAREAERRHLPVEISIFGDGELRGAVQAQAPSNTSVRGFLPFDPEWLQHFREAVDVAILPHPQGDPSMTYFEALGCGVPVLGYANATWGMMARLTGGGWALRRRGGVALAEQVEVLVKDPGQVQSAALAGLEFMRSRTFEQTFRLRMQHLRESVMGHLG